MKPVVHARSSAAAFGGAWTDYIGIHDLVDSSKAAVSTNHHRALYHNDWGGMVARRVFGETMTNSDGVGVSVAAVFERHCLEDVGRVPSVEEWTDRNARPPSWLANRGCPRSLEAIREDAATGLAARYGTTPGLFAPVLDLWDHGARRSERWGVVAALTLNSATIIALEAVTGPVLETADGRTVAVREVGELVALARWGVVPSLHEVVGGIRLEPWMSGRPSRYETSPAASS